MIITLNKTVPSLFDFRRPVDVEVKLEYGDPHRNGHNTFTITGTALSPCGRYDASGCIHEEIAEVFPELRHLIPFHLFSDDGPMHYLANTLYLAGDRDSGGLRAGEPSRYKLFLTLAGAPVPALNLPESFLRWAVGHAQALPDMEVIPLYHPRDRDTYSPKYTIGSYPAVSWHQGPFDTLREAESFLGLSHKFELGLYSAPIKYSEGKVRELEAARRAAVWPEATDETLCLPPEELKTLLEERLPALIEEFHGHMKAIGLRP